MVTTFSNRHSVIPWGQELLVPAATRLFQPSMGVKPMTTESIQHIAMMPLALWPVTRLLYLIKTKQKQTWDSNYCRKYAMEHYTVISMQSLVIYYNSICLKQYVDVSWTPSWSGTYCSVRTQCVNTVRAGKGCGIFSPNPHIHALTLLQGNVHCLGVKLW